MSKKKGDVDHVTLGDNSVRCLNCGDEQPIAFPVSIRVLDAIGKAFGLEHRACKPSDTGAARFRAQTLSEWAASWDTGISSRTIFHTFMGYGGPQFAPDVPYDPADFGRCYRLLKIAPPEWRANLAKVAARYPAWGPLVDRWDDLERLFEEELPTGKAPRLYALMRELRGVPA